MKKSFRKILGLMMVLVLAMAFISCDDASGSDDDDDDVIDTPSATVYEYEFGFDTADDQTSGDITIGQSGNASYSLVADANDNADGALDFIQTYDATETVSGSGYWNDNLDAGTGLFNITEDFSAEVVFYSERANYDLLRDSGVTTGDETLQMFEFANSDSGWKLLLENNEDETALVPVFRVYDEDASKVEVEGSTEVSIGTGDWHHILVTYDSTTLTTTMYLDGVSIGSETLTGPRIANTDADSDKFNIAGGSSVDDKNLEGAVDNVYVCNWALTATEVATRAATFGF